MRSAVVCGALLAALSVLLLQLPQASATPRMSAASGAPCTTCHYNDGGGGVRTSIGFDTQRDIAAFSYDDLGVGFLDSLDTNALTDWMNVGIDTRVQAARSLQEPPVDDDGQAQLPDPSVFPMQFEPGVAVFPTDWLSFLGSWAMGPGIGDGDFCSAVYPGQMCGTAQAVVEPSPGKPKVRAGMFQPNFGIRHDDHTALITSDVSRTPTEVIPPNYAEVGVETNYQPRHWFRADAGVYRSDQLSAAVGDDELVEAGDPAGMARVTFYPQFDAFDRSFYTWTGASTYASGHLRGEGNFRMDKVFLGVGILDRAALMVDLAHLDFSAEGGRRALNASTTLSVELKDWLIARGRLEQGTTRLEDTDADERRRAAVAGVQLYPIPFFKLQPEYRIIRHDDGQGQWTTGQYALQLHMYY